MKIIDQAYNGMPISVPIIDSHTHILEYYYLGWHQSFTSNEAIVSLLDHMGVDCIVTAPHSLILGNMEYTNEKVLEASRAFPGKIYGYISVLPHEGLNSVKKILNKYSKSKVFVGLKFLAGYHGTLLSKEYAYALDFAQEIGCPVLCHVWDTPPLEEVEKVVKTRPDLKLMAAHQGGGNMENTNKYVKMMNNYSNLYMEICGGMFNGYSMEQLVELAGESRVIYGSDQINIDPRYDFGKVVFSTLDDKIKRKLLAENYLELLKGSQMGTIELK